MEKHSPLSFTQNQPYILSHDSGEDLLWVFQRMYVESISSNRSPVMQCLGELLVFHARELITTETTTNTLAVNGNLKV